MERARPHTRTPYTHNAEYWEKRYAAKRDEKYDISQTVYSAMFEALEIEKVRNAMNAYGFAEVEELVSQRIAGLQGPSGRSQNKYHQQLLKYVTDEPGTSHAKLESFFWLHHGYAAFVRMLFRMDAIPNMREQLCMLAGKLLQRKEVCNKAGVYSSLRQRSDVVDELNAQVRTFLNFLDALSPTHIQAMLTELNKPEWIFYVVDHTALPSRSRTCARRRCACWPSPAATRRP
jgi:hypothetical protein